MRLLVVLCQACKRLVTVWKPERLAIDIKACRDTQPQPVNNPLPTGPAACLWGAPPLWSGAFTSPATAAAAAARDDEIDAENKSEKPVLRARCRRGDPDHLELYREQADLAVSRSRA